MGKGSTMPLLATAGYDGELAHLTHGGIDVQDSFTEEVELDLSEDERHAAAFLIQNLLAVE